MIPQKGWCDPLCTPKGLKLCECAPCLPQSGWYACPHTPFSKKLIPCERGEPLGTPGITGVSTPHTQDSCKSKISKSNSNHHANQLKRTRNRRQHPIKHQCHGSSRGMGADATATCLVWSSDSNNPSSDCCPISSNQYSVGSGHTPISSDHNPISSH